MVIDLNMISPIDHYIDILQIFISTHFILAPLLLLVAEEVGIPLLAPGDTIIGYVGSTIARTHHAAMWQAFVLSLISVLIGSSLLYAISRKWGQPFINALGRFLFLKEKNIKRAEDLFARYGVFGVIIGRFIPGIRVAVTIFAASSGIRYRVFLIGTAISSSIWILFFLLIGKQYSRYIQALTHKYIGISFALTVAVSLAIMLLHIVGIYRKKAQATEKTPKIP